MSIDDYSIKIRELPRGSLIRDDMLACAKANEQSGTVHITISQITDLVTGMIRNGAGITVEHNPDGSVRISATGPDLTKRVSDLESEIAQLNAILLE